MKKVRFLSYLLIVLPIFCHAYEPMLTEGKYWSRLLCNDNFTGDELVCQKLDGDTIINEKLYSILWESDKKEGINTIIGFMREDIEEQKVYMIPRYCDSQKNNEEYLIYSFNAKIGDLVHVYCADYYVPTRFIDFEIINIDTTQGYKKLDVVGLVDYPCGDNTCGGTTDIIDSWIEGIGSSSGFGATYGARRQCGEIGWYELLLVQKSSQIIYQNKNLLESYHLTTEDCLCNDTEFIVQSFESNKLHTHHTRLTIKEGILYIIRDGEWLDVTGKIVH